MTEAVSTVPGTTVAPEITTVTTKLAASATKKGFGTVLMPNYCGFISAALTGWILRLVLN